MTFLHDKILMNNLKKLFFLKITDVGVRSITDMSSIKHLITEGCTSVSAIGVQYFNSKTNHRLGS